MDFAAYDLKRAFTLELAATLAAGVESITEESKPKVQAIFEELMRDASTGALPLTKRAASAHGGGQNFATRQPSPVREEVHWHRCEASREALTEWFRRRGYFPAFLFPEYRPGWWGTSGTAFDRFHEFRWREAAAAFLGLPSGYGATLPKVDEARIRDGAQALEQAALAGELRHDRPAPSGIMVIPPTNPADDRKISRAELRAYCERRGLRPAFLFGGEMPNENATSSTIRVQQEVSGKTKSALYRALLAVALSAFKERAVSKPYEIGSEVERDAKGFGLDVKAQTVGNYLKEARKLLAKDRKK